MKTKVTEESGKIRLDKFLADYLDNFTRAFLQKLIKGGHVKVNSLIVEKSGFSLNAGDLVEIDIPEPRKIEAKAEKIDLDILFEDSEIIVVNKPAGMVVHPSESGGHISGTLVNAILHHCGNGLTGISGALRPGIVHRLDKNTSGVLVVAKTDLAQQELMNQFKDRKVKKEYVALVRGEVSPSEATIDSPIGRSVRNRKKMAIVDGRVGRSAITKYNVDKVFKDSYGVYSLVNIDLKTGRTHQIRVHMNAIGYPVVGDVTYGDLKCNKHFVEEYSFKRQFLHAKKLSFTHPKTGKEVSFEGELANDLKKVILLLQ